MYKYLVCDRAGLGILPYGESTDPSGVDTLQGAR